MASPKTMPKDAQVMMQILKDMGITEYEPRVINQMLEFTYNDIRLAIQCRVDQSFTSPPPRDFLLDIARQKNQTPLPLIKPYTGVISEQDNSATLKCGCGTPSVQTVGNKVGTPVSLTSQRFTVQIPSSQATAVKTATPTTPTVQNVLINPSLIGSKNILITTNMVSQNSSDSVSLKRKHEDEEDYDAL
ncbi:hypothetical protein DNTS_024000 [Danionella cerebrum]|uniref:Transcription initiation factor TFIID subunit 9B n=1 Tax=Danionella cerebrum TaxID=2873325 RepID=A0A553MVB7_9TELE|nr:hypothetical protein DNTS_024000 [Danionella translucida]